MIKFKNQKILVIAPHPDDEVIGCGGLIHRAKKEGAKVYILFMTVGDVKAFSKKGFSTQNEREREVKRLAKFLKYDGYRIVFPGNEYHLKLDAVPQKEIAHEIERGEKISLEAIKPDIILAPQVDDYNQDHRAVARAVITATRPTPKDLKVSPPLILLYEFPVSDWSVLDQRPNANLFLKLDKKNIQAKMKAMDLYESQIKPYPHFISSEALNVLAKFRGIQCGVEHAEAFILKRLTV
jgi:LmbE family N-acetylglucosaminyl deacetylase